MLRFLCLEFIPNKRVARREMKIDKKFLEKQKRAAERKAALEARAARKEKREAMLRERRRRIAMGEDPDGDGDGDGNGDSGGDGGDGRAWSAFSTARTSTTAPSSSASSSSSSAFPSEPVTGRSFGVGTSSSWDSFDSQDSYSSSDWSSSGWSSPTGSTASTAASSYSHPGQPSEGFLGTGGGTIGGRLAEEGVAGAEANSEAPKKKTRRELLDEDFGLTNQGVRTLITAVGGSLTRLALLRAGSFDGKKAFRSPQMSTGRAFESQPATARSGRSRSLSNSRRSSRSRASSRSSSDAGESSPHSRRRSQRGRRRSGRRSRRRSSCGSSRGSSPGGSGTEERAGLSSAMLRSFGFHEEESEAEKKERLQRALRRYSVTHAPLWKVVNSDIALGKKDKRRRRHKRRRHRRARAVEHQSDSGSGSNHGGQPPRKQESMRPSSLTTARNIWSKHHPSTTDDEDQRGGKDGGAGAEEWRADTNDDINRKPQRSDSFDDGGGPLSPTRVKGVVNFIEPNLDAWSTGGEPGEPWSPLSPLTPGTPGLTALKKRRQRQWQREAGGGGAAALPLSSRGSSRPSSRGSSRGSSRAGSRPGSGSPGRRRRRGSSGKKGKGGSRGVGTSRGRCGVDDSYLEAMPNYALPALTACDLGDCFMVGRKALRDLLSSAPQIRALNLEGCPLLLKGGKAGKAGRKFLQGIAKTRPYTRLGPRGVGLAPAPDAEALAFRDAFFARIDLERRAVKTLLRLSNNWKFRYNLWRHRAAIRLTRYFKTLTLKLLVLLRLLYRKMKWRRWRRQFYLNALGLYNAGCFIQRVVRGFIGRVEAQLRRVRIHEAAGIIQRALRRHWDWIAYFEEMVENALLAVEDEERFGFGRKKKHHHPPPLEELKRLRLVSQIPAEDGADGDDSKRSPSRRTTADGTLLYSDEFFCTGTSFTTDLDVMRVFSEKHSENHLEDEGTERTPLARPLKKRSFYR